MRQDIMALPREAKALFLYGGGIDMEWLHGLRPDVMLTAFERNAALWPAMQAHAKRVPFTAVMDECQSQVYGPDQWNMKHRNLWGQFAFAFVDTCSEIAHACITVTQTARFMHYRAQPRRRWSAGASVRWGVGASVMYVTVMGSNRRGTRPENIIASKVNGLLLGECVQNWMYKGLVSKVMDYPQASSPHRAELYRLGLPRGDWDDWNWEQNA